MDATSIALLLSILTTGIGAWNGFMNLKISKVVAELRLNIMKDMNGRYVSIDRFEDLKERVTHVEQAEDH